MSLSQALAQNWIEFWCQPKIDLRKRQLVGVEMLARLRHPRHGLLTPGEFMASADAESQLALSECAIDHAIKLSLECRQLGIALRVALNASPSALYKLPVERIAGEVKATCPEWRGLIVDLSAAELSADRELDHDLLNRLKAVGVAVAVDNFTLSTAHLSRLMEIEFCELKIDPKFVRDCARNTAQFAACKSIVDAARTFGAKVVAIGVESAADAHALYRLGCDVGQGFFFGSPTDQAQLMRNLQERISRLTTAA